MVDSKIMCDEVIESYLKETKNIRTSFGEKEATCKMQNSYILLAFLLNTIALLIAIGIYVIWKNSKQNKNIYHHSRTQIKN